MKYNKELFELVKSYYDNYKDYYDYLSKKLIEVINDYVSKGNFLIDKNGNMKIRLQKNKLNNSSNGVNEMYELIRLNKLDNLYEDYAIRLVSTEANKFEFDTDELWYEIKWDCQKYYESLKHFDLNSLKRKK